MAPRSQMLIQLVLAGIALDMEDAIPTRVFPSSLLFVNGSDMAVQVPLSPERLGTAATAEDTSKRLNVEVDDMSFKFLACVKFGFLQPGHVQEPDVFWRTSRIWMADTCSDRAIWSENILVEVHPGQSQEKRGPRVG